MSEKFHAIVADKNSEGKFSAGLTELSLSDLPNESVLIDVEYSTLNYKDGLAFTNAAPICQSLPMVCGIDLAGTVLESSDDRFKPGDKVLTNGNGLSERHWGGYSQKQRVNADFLQHVPDTFSTQQAMAIGTAGYTAMLCVNALRDHGTQPEDGKVLVTGSAGGVGTTAIMLLSKLGYDVVASTGRPETEAFLRSLGAKHIVSRSDLEGEVKMVGEEKWAAGIDCVGGSTLANLISQLKYNGVVAACGLAGGMDIPTNVIPFILRNVRLQGCDSVMAPMAVRERAWADLAEIMDVDLLESNTKVEPLNKVPELAGAILRGEVKGRVVIDVNA